jgi:multiple sugar transport system substrate-binding protein
MARRGANRRTTTAVAALALLAPLALASCGGGSSGTAGGSGDDNVLNVQDYYVDEPGHTFYQKLDESCAKEQGLTLKRQSVPGSSLIAKVLQQSSSRTLPDVLMLDNPDLQQIAASGALAPLSDFGITADGYAKGVVDASSYEGKLYGLQPATNTIALFYNKDILAKAGVTPPATWDELKATATKLTAGDQYGVAFSAVGTYEGTWQFLPFMWSNGGDEKNIATPETAAALQLWVDLVKDGSASNSVVNWEQADVNDQFKAGKAAMMVNGPWQEPVLDATQGLNYGIVPIPVPKAGDEAIAPLGGETYTVPQTGNKAKQAKAAKFVQCLNSDANMTLNATTNHTVPTKTSVAATYAEANPNMKTFVDLVPTLRARSGQLGTDWPKAATKIYTAVQTAITGGQSPAQALSQAQNG